MFTLVAQGYEEPNATCMGTYFVRVSVACISPTVGLDLALSLPS